MSRMIIIYWLIVPAVAASASVVPVAVAALIQPGVVCLFEVVPDVAALLVAVALLPLVVLALVAVDAVSVQAVPVAAEAAAAPVLAVPALVTQYLSLSEEELQAAV